MILPLIIYLVVTLGVVAGTFVASAYLFPDARQVRRRLAQEFRETDDTSTTSKLFKSPDRISLDSQTIVSLNDTESKESRRPNAPPPTHLTRLLNQANSSWKPSGFISATCLLASACALAGYLAGGWLLAGIAAAAGLLLPVLYLNARARQRQEKYLKQLPAAFELMARVIRAGQSVSQALQAVVDAFEDPLAAEFAHCQMQVGLGIRPEIAFREMAQRSGIIDMRIFVMALLIQQKTGGNLSEVLERLALMIRARMKLRSQVKTLTAEGRLQGWTLVVLPFVVFGAMMIVNRQYAETLLANTSLLLITGLAMLVGVIWIRKIVSFEY